jgi:hypothetical protein
MRSRDSVVGIATCYGLEGPGIESRWGWDFPHLSRPAPRPSQPPLQWVPGLSRRQGSRGVVLTTHPHLVPRYTKRSRAIPLLSPKRPWRPIRKGYNLKPSQTKSTCHKGIWWTGGTSSHILNPGTRWRPVLSFILWFLFTHGSSLQNWVATAELDVLKKNTISCPCCGVGLSVHSQVPPVTTRLLYVILYFTYCNIIR